MAVNENLARNNEHSSILRIDIAVTQEESSKAYLQVINTYDVAIVYKFKSNFLTRNVQIQPNQVGLIERGRRTLFTITLTPGYDDLQRFYFILGTAIIPNTEMGIRGINAATIWPEVVESNVTTSRIGLNLVRRRIPYDPKRARRICVGDNPNALLTTTDMVLFLSLLFGTGYHFATLSILRHF